MRIVYSRQVADNTRVDAILAPCGSRRTAVVGKAGHDVQGFGRSGRVHYLGNCNAGSRVRAGAGSQRQHRRNGQGRERRGALPGVTVTVTTPTPARPVPPSRTSRACIARFCCRSAATPSRRSSRASASTSRRASPSAPARPSSRRARRRQRQRDGDRPQRVACGSAGPDRPGTDDQRDGDPQPAPGLAPYASPSCRPT